MNRARDERRLVDLTAELRRLRAELAVTEEQLLVFAEQRDDARVRALVSETPLASREYQETERTYVRHEAYRDSLRSKIAELSVAQDEFLDQFAEPDS